MYKSQTQTRAAAKSIRIDDADDAVAQMPETISHQRAASADHPYRYVAKGTHHFDHIKFEPASTGLGYAVCKRIFDLLAGSALLVFALPLILIAALLIRLETKGSPFFVQTRVGRNGKPFRIVKLRGMFVDARIRFASMYDYSKKQSLDFFFHLENDPRVTRAGRFIRKTSIDELPNLWNVVVGDMSLVGPRPEIPEVMALYGGYRDEYLSVKPGVTCFSKCTGRDHLTKRETIEYDLAYVRNPGFKIDWQIMWRTFRGVILRRDVF